MKKEVELCRYLFRSLSNSRADMLKNPIFVGKRSFFSIPSQEISFSGAQDKKVQSAFWRAVLFWFWKSSNDLRVMSPMSGARWELRASAAGGGNREPANTAAAPFAGRSGRLPGKGKSGKAARSDNPEVVGSNPSPATTLVRKL